MTDWKRESLGTYTLQSPTRVLAEEMAKLAVEGAPLSAPGTLSSSASLVAPWPASVSRDTPEKLSAETKGHTFFVRTDEEGFLLNIDVLGFIAKCPDVGDGRGVTVHRDVIHSLAYHLLDKVHELETLRGSRGTTEAVPLKYYHDEKLSKLTDLLGDKDAEIKELRAALGEAAVKIRRFESKIFK